MLNEISLDRFKLLLFSIAISLITYGFNLTNFSVTIDSELPFDANMSLELGRWGTNLVTYHIFHGIIPYFTLLIALVLLSIAAVLLAALFRLNTVASYVFCALFLSFPQMAYQLYFSMQSDAVALGFALSAFALLLFKKATDGSTKRVFSILTFIVSALLIMTVIAIYQALALVPVVIYLVTVFQSTYAADFKFKKAFTNAIIFAGLMLLGGGLYALSLPILCPNMGNSSYLSSYASGNDEYRFINFYNILVDNFRGDYFYGDKTFFVSSLLCIAILVTSFIKERKVFLPRALVMLALLILPFIMSLFITGAGYYHPPRIFVSSGIVFAFFITHYLSHINFPKVSYVFLSFVVLLNIFFITKLFVAHHEIYTSDLATVTKIDDKIRTLYPDFEEEKSYVYFYGKVADNTLDRFRLPLSEVFAGSHLQWDGGNNYRISYFMKYCNVANYKVIDNTESYVKIKDSIGDMPTWPKNGSIKRIDNVVIVKLGREKGAPLWVE